MMRYDSFKLINGYILELHDGTIIKNYLILNPLKGATKIADVKESVYDYINYLSASSKGLTNKALSVKHEINNVDPTPPAIEPEPDESDDNQQTDETISNEQKVQNGQALVTKMNEIINQGIEVFQSNQEFVKIEATSDDYNQIILDVAKQFTINNNTNKKIDTQILSIVINAGDLNEFSAVVYDRQDIADEEKRHNEYYYRIKKAGNYYLAARVTEDVDVNVGLTSLAQPIHSDTSMTTDFLYRIEGKKYIGNKWG